MLICVLAVILLFSCVACQKDDTNPQSSQSQTTTETTTISTTENTEDAEPTLSPEEIKETIIGKWAYDEIVTPENFYGEHYDPQITKTNIKMQTVYMFKNDGTFKTGVIIVNMEQVEKEYKSLMVEGARKEAESQGKYLSTDNVRYFEERAQKVLNEICKIESGKYVVDGKKISYTINGTQTEETFTLKGDKLTVKGVKDNQYSITLTKQ